jgi:hypothetical protein
MVILVERQSETVVSTHCRNNELERGGAAMLRHCAVGCGKKNEQSRTEVETLFYQ